MDGIRTDWNSLNDKKEIDIIEKYSYKMNIYTIIFTRKGKKDILSFLINYLISEIYLKKLIFKRLHYISQHFVVFFCISFIIFIFIEFLPIILDIVVPLNETRPRSMHVEAEYFVDPEKYFPLMVLHELTACLVGFSTLVATGTIMMAYAQHGCGMLKIVR